MSEVKHISYEGERPDVPSEYQGLLDANPYLEADYNKSFWQKVIGALGFRTGYDKRKEDLALQASEYDSQVALLAQQNAYNDPSAQAARKRAAGLNPDLTGVDDVAGAAGMQEDNNPPAPTETDAQSVGQFANVIMSAVTMGMGLAKDSISLASLRNAVEVGNVEKARSMGDFALQALLTGTEENPVVNDPEHGDYLASGWQDRAADAAFDAYSSSFRRRDQKRFRAALDVAKRSLPTSVEQYKLLKERVGNRKDFWMSAESSDYSEFDSVMSVIAEELGSLNKDIMSQQKTNQLQGAELQNQQIVKEGEYLDSVDASMIGQAETAGAVADIASSKERAQNANINQAIRSTYARIVNRLEKLADSNDRGHTAASIALLALQVVSMMSVSQSSSSGFDMKRGSFNSKTTSFGF